MSDRQHVSKADEFLAMARRIAEYGVGASCDAEDLAACVLTNRDLIARALRLLAIVENPSDKLIDMIYDVSEDADGGGYAILENLLHWQDEAVR